MEEQHPVPQDITGFQFKLVGDMTLKQFGELAGGAIMAYLFYASGWNPLIRWPLVIFFGFFGVALAFFPIEERPLDVWIMNFLKAIYRPTYFVWKKDAGGTAIAVSLSPKVKEDMTSAVPPVVPKEEPALQTWTSTGLPPVAKVAPEEEKKETPVDTIEKVTETKEVTPQDSLTRVTLEEEQAPRIASMVVEKPALSIEELEKLREQKLAELTVQKKKLEQKTVQVKEDTYRAQNAANIITVDKLAELRQQKITPVSKEDQAKELVKANDELLKQIADVSGKIVSLSGTDKDVLQAQLNSLNKEKDKLAAAIVSLGQAGATPVQPSQQPASEQITPPWASGATGQARIVDRPIKPQQPISLTNAPNIINGAVFDQRGAPMEGVVMVIKDKAGNSVRALKTNRIGQFIVSTPLENGSYYLEFEMPNYDFNVYEIVLSGQVIAPLEIRGRYLGPKPAGT